MVSIEMFCGRSCFENMVEQMGCPRNALDAFSKASCLDTTGRCLHGLSCAVAQGSRVCGPRLGTGIGMTLCGGAAKLSKPMIFRPAAACAKNNGNNHL